MLKAVHVGVDISGERNVAQFLDQDGNLLRKPFSFSNDSPGLSSFVEVLRDVADSHKPEVMNIGMEATGFYWWHLEERLSEDGFLDVETRVFVINPSLIKAFKKAYTSLPKTDAVDAWVIADKLRFGRLTPVSEKALIYAPLARLTRLRYHLKRAITGEKNRALSLMFLKFSEYKKAAGRRAFNKAPLDLLNELTIDEVAEKPMEELLEYVLSHGNSRISNPEEFVVELKAAARRSFRLNPKMEDAVGVALSLTTENIRFLEGQCKKLDSVIARELRAIPQTLDTVPGIGPVTAAGIISEIGDVSRFQSQAALAKFAGLTWHRYQSGRFDAEETSLTKAGNAYLRYYLVEAANSLRLHNEEYSAYYRKKYSEVPKHQHKRALVLTARKFVRLVFALLSKGQIYRTGVVN